MEGYERLQRTMIPKRTGYHPMKEGRCRSGQYPSEGNAQGPLSATLELGEGGGHYEAANVFACRSSI